MEKAHIMKMAVCIILILSFSAWTGVCQAEVVPEDDPGDESETEMTTEDHSFNIGFDVAMLSIMSMLHLTSDIYITPQIGINNSLIIFHDRVPSIGKEILTAVSDLCCSMLSAMSYSSSSSYDSPDYYSDNYTVMYLFSFHFFFEKYKGIYLGGGSGADLFYNSDINQYYLGILLFGDFGYQFFSNSKFFAAVELQGYLPLCWFPEIVAASGNLFGSPIYFASLHIGYMP